MSNSFIQVPPDSTGKKIYTQQYTVDTATVQAQVFHLAGKDTPNNLQSVDIRGQANVRFAEGSPTMDAFGNLRIGEQHSIGSYEYTNDAMSDLFTESTIAGGTITYNADASEVILSTTTATTSLASRTTNRYHFYSPGISNHIITTLAHGDTGKANNVRRWGAFDSENGIFFELNGTTLNAVIRNSRTGTVVETRTDRSQWADKLDGTGLSGMVLDLSKANLYWIDYAWLGVGVVRFGIVSPDGTRWPVHIQQNPNNNIGVYMRSGSLPIAFENKNIGSTSGSSDMRLICSAVFSSSTPSYTFWRYAATMASIKSVTTNTPLISIKPKLSYNGNINRVGLYPESISVYVTGGAVSLSINDDATLTGATYAVSQETANVDVAATAMVPTSPQFVNWILAPGSHQIDLTSLYELNDEGYHVLADGTNAYQFTLSATKLEATGSVFAVVNYRELR